MRACRASATFLTFDGVQGGGGQLLSLSATSAAAGSSLPTIVDQVEADQEIELTRRGKAVAVVLSLREFARLRGERVSFGDAYKRFLTAHALHDVGLDPGFPAAARNTATGRKVTL